MSASGSRAGSGRKDAFHEAVEEMLGEKRAGEKDSDGRRGGAGGGGSNPSSGEFEIGGSRGAAGGGVSRLGAGGGGAGGDPFRGLGGNRVPIGGSVGRRSGMGLLRSGSLQPRNSRKIARDSFFGALEEVDEEKGAGKGAGESGRVPHSLSAGGQPPMSPLKSSLGQEGKQSFDLSQSHRRGHSVSLHDSSSSGGGGGVLEKGGGALAGLPVVPLTGGAAVAGVPGVGGVVLSGKSRPLSSLRRASSLVPVGAKDRPGSSGGLRGGGGGGLGGGLGGGGGGRGRRGRERGMGHGMGTGTEARRGSGRSIGMGIGRGKMMGIGMGTGRGAGRGIGKGIDPLVLIAAVTALLNLSLVAGAPAIIATVGGIAAITDVLRSGSPAARENAAAALFALSVDEANQTLVRKAGAILPLVGVLRMGSTRGKKDAALVLFNLSRDPQSRLEIVRADAVKVLLGLLGCSEVGLEEKAMAVLANLCRLQEGCEAVLRINGAVPALVAVVEGGSQRAKEDAVMTLLMLANSEPDCCRGMQGEGMMEVLHELTRNGSSRCKSKAKALVELLQMQGEEDSE
ncbi:unnamed protein product [Closterium sp. NIES-65]|nr:unnamed protein product [Closterium sp. NIES-65]